MKKTMMAAALLALLAVCAPAAAVPRTQALSSSAIDALVRRESSRFLTTSTAVSVLDATTGETAHDLRGNQSLLPASTMKIITATVALETMGPSHRFKTTALWNAELNTVYLVGGGDPVLRSKQLHTLADSVSAYLPAGTKRVLLQYDVSRFPSFTLPAGWVAGQVPGEVRPVTALQVDDRSVKRPAQYAAQVFARYLTANGLEVTIKGHGTATGELAGDVKSQELRGVIRKMLHDSNNNIAETLFRNSAVEAGLPGDWTHARQHAIDTLTSLGVPLANTKFVDGSGLSRSNRITTNTLSRVLLLGTSADHPKLLPMSTEDLLPAAGKEGTLRLRFHDVKTACAAGLVEAKTGSLRDVISLAGYAKGTDGSTAVFAMIVNRIPRSRSKHMVRYSLDWMVTGLTGCTPATPAAPAA